MKPVRRVVLYLLLLVVVAGPSTLVAQNGNGPLYRAYRETADRIIDAALGDSVAYQRLTELVDRFGPRFSGTVQLERAIDWILGEMERDGLRNVRGEPVMVPRWVRGEESAELVSPRPRQLPMLALGGSVGTPPGGITGEVMVVSSFEELDARADEARGRIVLFNPPWVNYGVTVAYRGRGAVAAARAGAIASLIRSVTPYSLQTPHTGAMQYDPDVPQIPHAALTVEDCQSHPANASTRGACRRAIDDGSAHAARRAVPQRRRRDRGDRASRGDRRTRRPHRFLGRGPGRDGRRGGSVAAWEAVRLIQRLGLRPRRTIRVVLWTNEENGLRGGNAYRDAHLEELDRHVMAMESDGGVFKPFGFGFGGSDAAFAIVSEIGSLLDRIDAGRVQRPGGGADIGPLMREGVPGLGLQVDGSRYFWYHHTDADTIDKLDPREMAECVAAMAVMAYVVADLDEPLPR